MRLFTSRVHQVCRITFTATTRNKDDTIKAFGNGGTLFKLKIFDGRDISKLSLYESEMEVILWPNSTFRVTATLSSDEVFDPHPRRASITDAAASDI
jgi:hypothetical protein